MKILPDTMPSAAGDPSRMMDISGLLESTSDKVGQSVHGSVRVLAGRSQAETASLLRRQHQHTHDALSVHLQAVLFHGDVSGEPPGQLHEFGRGPCVHPGPVYDL